MFPILKELMTLSKGWKHLLEENQVFYMCGLYNHCGNDSILLCHSEIVLDRLRGTSMAML